MPRMIPQQIPCIVCVLALTMLILHRQTLPSRFVIFLLVSMSLVYYLISWAVITIRKNRQMFQLEEVLWSESLVVQKGGDVFAPE